MKSPQTSFSKLLHAFRKGFKLWIRMIVESCDIWYEKRIRTLYLKATISTESDHRKRANSKAMRAFNSRTICTENWFYSKQQLRNLVALQAVPLWASSLMLRNATFLRYNNNQWAGPGKTGRPWITKYSKKSFQHHQNTSRHSFLSSNREIQQFQRLFNRLKTIVRYYGEEMQTNRIADYKLLNKLNLSLKVNRKRRKLSTLNAEHTTCKELRRTKIDHDLFHDSDFAMKNCHSWLTDNQYGIAISSKIFPALLTWVEKWQLLHSYLWLVSTTLKKLVSSGKPFDGFWWNYQCSALAMHRTVSYV